MTDHLYLRLSLLCIHSRQREHSDRQGKSLGHHCLGQVHLQDNIDYDRSGEGTREAYTYEIVDKPMRERCCCKKGNRLQFSKGLLKSVLLEVSNCNLNA